MELTRKQLIMNAREAMTASEVEKSLARLAAGGLVLDALTVRDYFAAQIASGDAVGTEGSRGWVYDNSADIGLHQSAIDRARLYYTIADAMLEVRSE